LRIKDPKMKASLNDTITVAGTEFYVDDIAEVILTRMIPDAEEDENGVLHVTLTEENIESAALDFAADHPDETGRGTAFGRLGFGYEVDRSVGFVELFDTPKELIGDYELEVEWTIYSGEKITSLKKVA
jgi:hypothetical protein